MAYPQTNATTNILLPAQHNHTVLPPHEMCLIDFDKPVDFEETENPLSLIWGSHHPYNQQHDDIMNALDEQLSGISIGADTGVGSQQDYISLLLHAASGANIPELLQQARRRFVEQMVSTISNAPQFVSMDIEQQHAPEDTAEPCSLKLIRPFIHSMFHYYVWQQLLDDATVLNPDQDFDQLGILASQQHSIHTTVFDHVGLLATEFDPRMGYECSHSLSVQVRYTASQLAERFHYTIGLIYSETPDLSLEQSYVQQQIIQACAQRHIKLLFLSPRARVMRQYTNENRQTLFKAVYKLVDDAVTQLNQSSQGTHHLMLEQIFNSEPFSLLYAGRCFSGDGTIRVGGTLAQPVLPSHPVSHHTSSNSMAHNLYTSTNVYDGSTYNKLPELPELPPSGTYTDDQIHSLPFLGSPVAQYRT